MEWAAPAGGGLTLINTGGTTLSGSSTSITSIPGTYKNLHVYIVDFYTSTGSQNGAIRFNSDTSATGYSALANRQTTNTGSGTPVVNGNNAADRMYCIEQMAGSDQNNFWYFIVPDYANAVSKKIIIGSATYTDSDSYLRHFSGQYTASTSAITSMQVVTSGTWSGGTVYVYGEQ